MANKKELDNFIAKFTNLWQFGIDVKLVVDVKADVASISSNVDVKLESLGNDTEVVGYHRIDGRSNRLSPCRQRRRKRREAKAEEVANELAETVDC